MHYNIEIHVRRHSPTMDRLMRVKLDHEINRGGINRARMDAEIARGIISLRIDESGKEFVAGLIQSLVGLPDIDKFTVSHDTDGGTLRSRLRPMYGDRH